MTTAPVLSYTPPTRFNPGASVEVACPRCVKRRRTGKPVLDKHGRELHLVHTHGVGAAGSLPVLGHRQAHCLDDKGGYVIEDLFGVVPERIELEEVTA